MQERLLQYIWQFRYFNQRGLMLQNGQSLEILNPGFWNHHQGPDFQMANIKIDGTVWVGQIELHVRASDWYAHAHHNDALYRNVVLHVVWEDDIGNADDPVPLLVLQPLVPKLLLHQYEEWMHSRQFIPCGQQIRSINPLVLMAWKDRLAVERLQRKTDLVFIFLEQTKYHWEETFWWLLARNFGVKVNADAFEEIARTLPFSLLARHRSWLQHLEALLLGQAGLLNRPFNSDYPAALKRDYEFYRAKYGLRPIYQPVHFLRMRPPAFPTVRLALLARLVHSSEHLFQRIIDTGSIDSVRTMLDVAASEFWDDHYTLDEPAPHKPKHVGEEFANILLVNTVVPVLFAYGCWKKEQSFKDRAIQWLQEIPPERNTITDTFRLIDAGAVNAFETQALLELKSQYCDRKKCLDCAVGNSLISLHWPSS